jgi:hypothetical protein
MVYTVLVAYVTNHTLSLLSNNFHDASGCHPGVNKPLSTAKKRAAIELWKAVFSSERHQGTAEHLRKVSEKDLEVCQGETSESHQPKKLATFKILTYHQEGHKEEAAQ